MIVDLQRFAYGPHATLGRLILPQTILYTIERPWRDNERFESCIPEGNYQVIPYSSAKYPDVWELQDVPGRDKILIHVANYSKDVQGCIGVGMELATNGWWVKQSRNAMTILKTLLPAEFEIAVSHYAPEYP